MDKFEIQRDLDLINFRDIHNWIHLSGSMLLVIVLSYFNSCIVSALIAYALGLAWEILDGFKPWFYDYKPLDKYSSVVNLLRQELLFSNKFSLQDVFFWNLVGTILGFLFLLIIN
jgi:hypothetical protein